MNSDNITEDERVLRLANNLRRRIAKKAGSLKAEVVAELGQAEENDRTIRAVVGVAARLDEVISSLESR